MANKSLNATQRRTTAYELAKERQLTSPLSESDQKQFQVEGVPDPRVYEDDPDKKMVTVIASDFRKFFFSYAQLEKYAAEKKAPVEEPSA